MEDMLKSIWRFLVGIEVLCGAVIQMFLGLVAWMLGDVFKLKKPAIFIESLFIKSMIHSLDILDYVGININEVFNDLRQTANAKEGETRKYAHYITDTLEKAWNTRSMNVQ